MLLVVLAAGLAGWALLADRAATAAAFARLPPGTVALAALCSLAIGLMAAVCWTGLARALGATGGWPTLARVFFVGQLGKYLPGPGWPVLLQGSLGSAARQPPESTAGAALVCVIAAPVVGVVLGVPLVAVGSPDRVGGLAWLLLPSVALLALLHPAVLPRLARSAARLTGRELVDLRLAPAALARAIGWQCLVWLAIGAQTGLLTYGVGEDISPRTALLGAGAGLLAYSAGMLALVVPAGLGVREGTMVLLLAPVLGTSAAAAVAVSSRILFTATDLLLAGAVLVGPRAPAGPAARHAVRAQAGQSAGQPAGQSAGRPAGPGRAVPSPVPEPGAGEVRTE